MRISTKIDIALTQFKCFLQTTSYMLASTKNYNL